MSSIAIPNGASPTAAIPATLQQQQQVRPNATMATLSPSQQIFCSSVSGCAGIFVGYPFDFIRVRLQTAERGTYSGVLDCVKKVVRQEGFTKLYAGLYAPLSVAPLRQSVIFGSNRIFNQHLSVDGHIFHHHLKDTNIVAENHYYNKLMEIEEGIEDVIDSKYFKLTASGMLTGVCNSFVVTPADQLKIMVQSGKAKKGAIKSLSKIYETHGLFNGIYRGWRASVTRELFYYGSYFLSYDYYRHVLSRINPFTEHKPVPSHNIFHPSTMFECLLAGGLAGCTAWTVNLPADYVKSRLQNDSIRNPKYSGMIDCLKKTYASHGSVKVFYTGLVPTLIRAFPTHATIFLTFELMKQTLLDQSDDDNNS